MIEKQEARKIGNKKEKENQYGAKKKNGFRGKVQDSERNGVKHVEKNLQFWEILRLSKEELEEKIQNARKRYRRRWG